MRVTFFWLAKRKSPKKRRPRCLRPLRFATGQPAVLAGGVRCGTRCAALQLRSNSRSESVHDTRVSFGTRAHPTRCAPRRIQRGWGSGHPFGPLLRSAPSRGRRRLALGATASAGRGPRRVERSDDPRGCLAVWLFGCLAVWLFGCLAVWLFGCLAVWLFGCLAVWLFGCLAVWLFGCLAVWLFGCLAVWLFGCLAVRLFGCSAVRLFGCLAVWLFGCLAVWLFGCLAVWLFGCLAVWLFGCSAVRLFGCSAVRLFGCSAVRLFGCSAVRLFGTLPPSGCACAGAVAGWQSRRCAPAS